MSPARACEEALVKIRAVLPETERDHAASVQVHAFQMPNLDDATRARLDSLEAAVNRRQRLFVTYATEDGTSTQRTIRPLGLWFWGKVWTLVAWCELRDDFRMFRVDRMSDPDLLDTFRHEPGKRLADFYARQKHP